MKQTAHTPPLVPPHSDGTLGTLIARNAELSPTRPAVHRHQGEHWHTLTAEEYRDQVHALAQGLIDAGIHPGDRVALMSRTRYEWTLLDFALATIGAVCVPVYETSSVDQVKWILEDSGAVAIWTETAAHREVVDAAMADRPLTVWNLDDGDVARVSTTPRSDVLTRLAAVRREDLATIVYTSGTTGRPKGCMLTHDNFLSLCENIDPHIPEVLHAPDATTVLFLPLAHVLGRIIQMACVYSQVQVGHCPDAKDLLAACAAVRPTFVLAVPRVFEKLYNSADHKAAAAGRGSLFRYASRVAITHSRAQSAGRVPLRLAVPHRVLDLLVYAKIRALFGGRLTYAVSGGGPLGERLGNFFRGAGITIIEGYGLTETTAPATVNTPTRLCIGSVGIPLPGSSIGIADDGEVLIKGTGVFRGYWNDPEATKASFTEDGWLRTGDLGRLDDAGFLHLTGRLKEILVTAGGKNVAPAVLEDRLRSHPLVSQCIVVGEHRPFISALITLDPDMVPAWGQSHDVPELTVEQALRHEVVRRHLGKAVERANQAVSRAESIRRFEVIAGDFTEANGLLTPSLKLKRDVITTRYAEVIERMYADPHRD